MTEFLRMTDFFLIFSPQAPLVVPVTNMVNICLVGQFTYLYLVFRELNLSFLQNGVTERKRSDKYSSSSYERRYSLILNTTVFQGHLLQII